MTLFLITYVFHCTWVTSEAYSSPSIVLSAKSGDGGRIIFDDFREAYYWLRQNTPEVQYLTYPLVPWPLESQSYQPALTSTISGHEGHVMVGLWLSDNGNG